MIVSIHQPSYFPWLGLLDKIYDSDIFVLMDDVQLADRAYQHRNIFLNNTSQTHMLTIPIYKKSYRNKPIRDLKINGNDWQKKHERFLIDNYKKYPFFEEIYSQISFIFSKNYIFLIDVLQESMNIIFNMLAFQTEIILQSNLDYNRDAQKEELIVSILHALEKEKVTYLSGIGAQAYQHEDLFKKHGIILTYQKFNHPLYSQYQNKEDFVSGLSSLDALFNLGIKKTKLLLENKS